MRNLSRCTSRYKAFLTAFGPDATVKPSATRRRMTNVLTADPVPLASAPARLADACSHCKAALSGPFCSECGQAARPPRLTLRAFASEIIAQIGQLDHGLLYTFVQLLRRPGPTIREYISGRRRIYTSPISYTLLAVGLAVLRNQLEGRADSL